MLRDRLKAEGFFQRGEGYLANYGLMREDVIRRVENNKGFGSIAVLKGNVAPEGAVVKFSAVGSDMLFHEGPVRVFDREETALNAVMSESIDPDSVIQASARGSQTVCELGGFGH